MRRIKKQVKFSNSMVLFFIQKSNVHHPKENIVKKFE